MTSPRAIGIDAGCLSPTVVGVAEGVPVVSDVTGAFWEMTLTTVADPFFDRPSTVESIPEYASA